MTKSREVVGAKVKGTGKLFILGNSEAHDNTGKAQTVAGALVEDDGELVVTGNTSASSNYQPNHEILKALDTLTEAIAGSQQLSSGQRFRLLREIKELHKQALLPPHRRAANRVRQAVSAIATFVQVGGALAEILAFFGLSMSNLAS
jgi:hypothetical protein